MLSQIQQRRVNPRQVVSEVFREELYGDHPLHRPISGYASTVSQITRDDVLAFYQRFYVPNNAILVMVGDFSAARMLELIEQRAWGLAGETSWTRSPCHNPRPPVGSGAHGGYGCEPELCPVWIFVGAPGRS